MRNQLDKVFRNKLAEHTVSPPPMAWSRVEASLSKKNKGLIWFRLAAAVLFLGLLTGGIFWLVADKTQQGTSIAKSGDSEKKPVEKNKQKGAAEVDTKAKAKVEKKKPAVRSTTNIIQHLAVDKKDHANESKANPTQPVEKKTTDENALQNNTVPLTETTVATVIPAEKPMVIEYAIGTVDPLPTEKSIVLTIDLKENLKEKKGLQKVLDFAFDAKNSDGALAGLRQAKDDLFAFNFTKKDKQKNPK